MTIKTIPPVAVQPVAVKSETSPTRNNSNQTPEQSNRIDIIMLEDDQIFASAFQFRFMKKKIKHYLDPRDFLAECDLYPKDTVISIDNNFGEAIPITGIEVAAQLNEKGFSRLFLVSGTYFYPNQLPAYLTFIEKLNLDYFDCV